MGFSIGKALGIGGGADYGKPYREDAARTIGQLGQIQDQLGDIASNAGGQINANQGQVSDARSNLLTLLGRRSGEADRARYINEATGNVDSNFLKGKADLDNAFAGHGIDPNAYAGALTNLAARKATATAGAANDANNALIARDTGNAESLYDVLTNAQNALKAQQSAALGQQAGVGEYRAGAMDNIAQQEQARGAQNSGILGGLIGGVTGVVGKALPALGVGGTRAAAAPSEPTDEEWLSQNLPGNPGYVSPADTGSTLLSLFSRMGGGLSPYSGAGSWGA